MLYHPKMANKNAMKNVFLRTYLEKGSKETIKMINMLKSELVGTQFEKPLKEFATYVKNNKIKEIEDREI